MQIHGLKFHSNFQAKFRAEFPEPEKAFSQINLFHEHGIWCPWVKKARLRGKRGAKK